jgi:hypothetical protein
MTEIEIANEFAWVRLQKEDGVANGPRLVLRDMRTGRTMYLDPLELEAISWMGHQELLSLLAPAFTRAREAAERSGA